MNPNNISADNNPPPPQPITTDDALHALRSIYVMDADPGFMLEALLRVCNGDKRAALTIYRVTVDGADIERPQPKVRTQGGQFVTHWNGCDR